MTVHVIVDYSFLYYKYKFQLDSGRMRRLTAELRNEYGDIEEKDVSQIYYSIREIEGFRRKLEQVGHDVIVSVCFDMKSKRKDIKEGASEAEAEAASNYKSNRVSRLTEEDFENIRLVEKILSKAGYNTYRIDGLEADDIISYIVSEYSESFDYNIIYTPDADLLVNIKGNVGASRYKSSYGYSMVDRSTFESYCSREFKCYMPYNAIMLYKATCGDASDCIAGIKRFGPKAFDKLVKYLTEEKGVNWEECGTFEKTCELLEKCRGYLTDEQIEQAYASLSMVRPAEIKCKIEKPTKYSDEQLRKDAYSEYGMKSLIA